MVRKHMAVVMAGLLVLSATSVVVVAQQGGVQEQDENEPNNNRSEATMIEFGVTVDGRINFSFGGLEEDWYQIDVSEGQKVVLNQQAAGAAAGVGVIVHDPDGNTVTEGTWAPPAAFSAINFTAEETGTYYIELEGEAPGEYQLAVTAEGEPGTGTPTETTTEETTTEATTTEETTTEATSPTASVVFDNQTTDGTTVVVESVTMSEGGFVAVHNTSGPVIGVSEYLSAGTHEDVVITLFDVLGQDFAEDMSLEENQTLIAMPHLGTNGNEEYEFVSSGGSEDGPYTANGSAVVDPASVTVADEMDTEATYYQIDFVRGEPIENLDWPNGTYTNDQLIRFAHGSTEEPITRRSEGEFTTDDELAERIDSQEIEVENGTAMITFTVAESESVTLSLASYIKPDPTWDPEDEDDQVFVDAQTETFESGTHTLTVDLPSGGVVDEDDEPDTDD